MGGVLQVASQDESLAPLAMAPPVTMTLPVQPFCFFNVLPMRLVCLSGAPWPTCSASLAGNCRNSAPSCCACGISWSRPRSPSREAVGQAIRVCVTAMSAARHLTLSLSMAAEIRSAWVSSQPPPAFPIRPRQRVGAHRSMAGPGIAGHLRKSDETLQAMAGNTAPIHGKITGI